MTTGHERPKVLTIGERLTVLGLILSAMAFGMGIGGLVVHYENAGRIANLQQLAGYRLDRIAELQAERDLLKNPPLTEAQLAQQAIDKEVSWHSWHMPAEIESELIDQPTLAPVGAAPGQQFTDPHDDPEWHHTRREFANEHCCCMVWGCTDDPKGDAIHHGIAANACIKAGHYELAVKPGPGQKFYRLCEKHHAEIGHGIGHGGSWTKFNLDIEADARAGRWNSRGKSEWRFMTEAELIAWVKERTD